MILSDSEHFELLIGGSCINVACIPTKALVRSAEVANLVHDPAVYGIRAAAGTVDMPAVAARTARMTGAMVDDHRHLYDESGLELVIGEGRFVEPRVVEAVLPGGGLRHLTAGRIFLDLGTRASVPDLPGPRACGPLTHVEALRLERVPDHLLVIGGGYVGLELAQAFRRLGSEAG